MFLRRPPAILVLAVAVDRLARGLGVAGFREIPRGGLDRRVPELFLDLPDDESLCAEDGGVVGAQRVRVRESGRDPSPTPVPAQELRKRLLGERLLARAFAGEGGEQDRVVGQDAAVTGARVRA
jgi:hypothetical protein